MKRLIELAEKIQDRELRKKVVEFINNPKLSHKDFKKYPAMKIQDGRTMFSAGGTAVERDILNHTIALAELCLRTADIVEKIYGIKINKDHLLAAAILHDIAHLFEYKKTKSGIEHTGVLLDHTMLGVAEFYHLGFPEQVIHIIAAHFGESGPTPPRSYEALLFHQLDNMLALTEYHLYGTQAQQPMQLLLFDDEILRQIAEKSLGEKTEK